ncbi:MAG: LptF/LptG family permease [Capnocytophaga sp.]|nr:LptF/LptG family permease [Capnocytophaga sp.]
MKILDRYILTQFLKNFFGALFILILIFVFHTIWMFIDELSGRDLELWIIGKFLFFYIPHLIPIILPLTVVLSSIMTFGSLSEQYEFAAMKASGISLLRAMRPLIFFMVLLSGFTFFLANNVIPVAHAEIVNLRSNIAKVKPAMAIAEGVFSDIGDEISIKVNKKTGDNDQYLESVVIHKKSPDRVNRTVINAERGELVSDKNSDFLQLILFEGTYYEDVRTQSFRQRERHPFAKVGFERYAMNIDLSKLNQVDFNEKNTSGSYKMLTVNQLNYAIDSISTDFKQNMTDYGNSLYRRTGIIAPPPQKTIEVIENEEINKINTPDELINIFEDWQRAQLFDTAINNNKSQVDNLDFKQDDISRRNKIINLHIITLSDKYALTIACLVLFFVAAPLGAFIRKGGLGLPMVFAMLLFLSYYFIGLFSKNIAEDGAINPAIAPWIPTLLLFPLGVYMTSRITTDKGMFQFEGITAFLNRIKKRFASTKK